MKYLTGRSLLTEYFHLIYISELLQKFFRHEENIIGLKKDGINSETSEEIKLFVPICILMKTSRI